MRTVSMRTVSMRTVSMRTKDAGVFAFPRRGEEAAPRRRSQPTMKAAPRARQGEQNRLARQAGAFLAGAASRAASQP
jgi:hypothetical protein